MGIGLQATSTSLSPSVEAKTHRGNSVSLKLVLDQLKGTFPSFFNVDAKTHRGNNISLKLVLDQLKGTFPFFFLQKMSGQVVRTHPPKF